MGKKPDAGQEVHGSTVPVKAPETPVCIRRTRVAFCLYYKVLERGHFPWPKATEGKVALTPAQMAMLWEG
ncbi:IS66 Orf2 like protein [Cereibacter ovatus]|uniref:IS66 Orf2 like protein n=1 Tax=Cereibacter ovatus TaxID=439529 RepID=A0A285D3Y5_9RHOB|nr:IS66 Orf2 like protein [Cereibacter ovatus]